VRNYEFFLFCLHLTYLLQSFIGGELPLGDLGVSSIDMLLSKLPREFTVDRYSRNGEQSVLKIVYSVYHI